MLKSSGDPLNFSNSLNFELEDANQVFDACIKNGANVVTAMAASEPHTFFELLCKKAADLRDVTIFCSNPNKNYSCFTDPSLAGRVRFHMMFLTASLKLPQGNGLVDYPPQHLSQWSSHLQERDVDVFWGVCSPPNEKGYVNLGLNLCYESELLRTAKKVILEVVPNLPQLAGATWVHRSEITHLVPYSGNLLTLQPGTPSAIDLEIAKQIAILVPDEATIQLGIGRIPDAMSTALRDKKNLGVHTELFTESMKDLFLAGVITGKRKSIYARKMVASFVLGSQGLYDFVDSHPGVELLPSSYVNDPNIIGRNHLMHSINTAVEVDITGQICSESVGHRELSGVGGATDTHLGAQKSRGGRGIIAIPSTTPNQEFSKIVFELKPGAKVSISRNDIDTIVTEYGSARLRGLAVSERVRKLIDLAHPNFRSYLTEKARSVGYI